MSIDEARPNATSDDLVRQIATLAPAGTPITPAIAEQLQAATQALMALARADGKLEQSPMTLAMERTVDLHREAAEKRLGGQRVLVTGGAGCVGSHLIPLLFDLGATEIAIADIAVTTGSIGMGGIGEGLPNGQLSTYQVDIRDAAALDAVFEEVRPHVVFHLASIREPGRAEAVVREAIETNVFGTRNVISACLRHGVEDAIYSSTGKCFAYVSDHVYTGSKKLAEAQWAAVARRSNSTRFRCTRFTHVMENGVVTQDIMEGIAKGLVGLHGPDRYFNIQNLQQAGHLLINALALADQTPADGFWAAVDLGWPVNTLELALYLIQRSGKPVALHFLGVPKGYDEVFFRGQFCWSGETAYHPLVNALEAPGGFSDPSGTMIGARVQTFSEDALAVELDLLKKALDDHTLNVSAVKEALVQAVCGLARSIFAAADLPRLVDVLWWGAAPAWTGTSTREAIRFEVVIHLLTDTVLANLRQTNGAMSMATRQKLDEVNQTLSRIPRLAAQSRSLETLLEGAGATASMK
ncbi:polysaccharide biosynthesis protein [Polaromonas sp. CG_9.11]|uniref:polysaccharide biosynthesis protein n=1 Tax=Polaromonas sp. CG_9.11 TaxID=2787730 RepID=UPI0018CA5A69|nr:polysaccharide biosynthesis protein [Polaromonas sp. CG_9.11]MBG6076553.1 nucleoside-diphosphate-sugar epimerase [Polaromonas sp. CG_9.11]